MSVQRRWNSINVVCAPQTFKNCRPTVL